MKIDKIEAEIFMIDAWITWMESKPLIKFIYKKQIRNLKNIRTEKFNLSISEREKSCY